MSRYSLLGKSTLKLECYTKLIYVLLNADLENVEIIIFTKCRNKKIDQRNKNLNNEKKKEREKKSQVSYPIGHVVYHFYS